jgi:hypothetical protein
VSEVAAGVARLRAVATAHGVALGGLVALASWTELTFRVLVPAVGQRHWPGYWAAARFALEGRTGVLYADAEAFGAAAALYGTVPDIFNPNAPTTLLAVLPFGLLPEATARVAWLVLGLGAFSVASAWLLGTLRASLPVALAATAAVAQFRPLREDLTRGQAYLPLLALLIAAAVLGARERGVRSSLVGGLALGAAAILKLPYGLAAWGAAVVGRRGVAAGVALALIAAAAALCAVAWGPGLWADYATKAGEWTTRPETAVSAFQTVNGWLAHLLRFDAAWNPGPVVDAPWLVTPLWLAAAGTVGAASAGAIWAASRSDAAGPARAMLSVAIVLPAATLLAPIAEQYHYTLSLLTIVVVGAILALERFAVRWWAGWAVGVALLGGPWPFNVHPVEGWIALAHYPRLYGAFVLWAVACLVARRGGGVGGSNSAGLSGGSENSSERPSG